MGTTADKLARLNETKALLKTRLTEKGLDVAAENNFHNLADKVGEIQGGGDIVTIMIEPELNHPPTINYINEDGDFSELKDITLPQSVKIRRDSIFTVSVSGAFIESGRVYTSDDLQNRITSQFVGFDKYEVTMVIFASNNGQVYFDFN